MIQVELTNRTAERISILEQFERAVRKVCELADVRFARVGVAIVEDREIHELNRRYLGHDYPTDVISFPMQSDSGSVSGQLEGEIAVSIDTARAQATRFGWTAEQELLLYVVHGALHLVGFDDANTEGTAQMRAAERKILNQLGVQIPNTVAGAATTIPSEESV